MAEEMKILTIKVSITVNCTFQPRWEKIQQLHMHREWRVAMALYRTENKARAHAGAVRCSWTWALQAPHVCPGSWNESTRGSAQIIRNTVQISFYY